MIEFESLFDCSNNVPFSKKMNAKTKEEQLDFKIKYFNRLARFSAKFLEIILFTKNMLYPRKAEEIELFKLQILIY
jgi:hypothetical protein